MTMGKVQFEGSQQEMEQKSLSSGPPSQLSIFPLLEWEVWAYCSKTHIPTHILESQKIVAFHFIILIGKDYLFPQTLPF